MKFALVCKLSVLIIALTFKNTTVLFDPNTFKRGLITSDFDI